MEDFDLIVDLKKKTKRLTFSYDEISLIHHIIEVYCETYPNLSCIKRVSDLRCLFNFLSNC